MVVLIINAFALLGLSHAFVFSGSYESDSCISDNNALSCICKNREDIAMSASMNFNINSIQVFGCGTVNVPFGAVPHLELKSIIFEDIHRLDIQPFAFVGAQTLHTLRIEHIDEFNVGTHGFVGLWNVTNIIIRNISSMNLQEGAFGGISDIKNFLIDNCNFGVVKNGAFILTNLTVFKILNSNIDIIDTSSILIHTAEQVSFQNCSIQEAKNYSVSVAYVDLFELSECSVGVLNTNSINLKRPGIFSLETCSISELYTYAITLIDIEKSTTFSNNVININYDYPVFIGTENAKVTRPSTENVSLNTCCNSFLCNCDIYWMWIADKKFYDLNTSFCIGTTTRLLDMGPVLDSHGNCMTLENKKSLKEKQNSAHLISTGIILKVPLVYLFFLYEITISLYSW